MADYDEEARRLVIKLVYYGPALSGKTTNLMQLHEMLGTELKGDLMTLETQNDRTLFFDSLPVGFRAPSGLMVKFRLFTVPGQVIHDGTRKAVLSRADGVAFIADSQKNQSLNNAESFRNLAENAGRVGISFEDLPLVVQYNKRDLPGIVEEEEILARWSSTKWPVIFASAARGEGVKETLEALLRPVYLSLDADFDLETEHGLSLEGFVGSVLKGET